MDTTGTLDEALERLHATGPERHGWLSNHAPMAVEALVRRRQGASVHRWLDHYRDKLEEMPAVDTPVTSANWREALGDPRRIADWALFFERETAQRPWRDVLAEWWPRLLPGIAGGATHPVIRVGHAVRTLLTTEETGPRVTELAHALGYWAARHLPLQPVRGLYAPGGAAAALELVPAVPDQSGGILHRLDQLTALPAWPAAGPRPQGFPGDAEGAAMTTTAGTTGIGATEIGATGIDTTGIDTTGIAGADTAQARLAELVAAATRRYATHGHGEPVMLVHAATAPNAVLRTLPALPRELWPASLEAAWAASAAVTAAYTPAEAAPAPIVATTPEEIFERAAAHGDEHAIKFTDTALDVGDALALTAAARSVELIEPFLP